MKTIEEMLYENSVNTPERLAVVFEDEEITYGELWESVVNFACYLSRKGISVGDRIIVQADYSKGYVIACFATHLVGGVFVPIDKSSNADVIYRLQEKVEAKFLVTKNKIIDDIESICISEIEKLKENIDAFEVRFPSLSMNADMMYTTGTTGNPKGVLLTHENIVSTVTTRMSELSIKKDNVGITFVPLNHVAPMRELYLNIYNGSTFIFFDGVLKLSKMLSYFDKYRVTSVYLPPSGISFIKEYSEKGLSEWNNQLDYVYSASSNMTEKQQEYMRNSLPDVRLFFSYGSSENGTVSLLRYHKELKDISCVGKTCGGVNVKIVDEDMNELPANTLGRIVIQSKMNFKEYWAMPELTEKVYRDNFFFTNDIGEIDDEGYLYVVGRIDDMINIGGLKVYPTEVEGIINLLPEVDECICIPVDDELTGKALKVLIKMNKDNKCSLNSIKKSLVGKMDSYKMPKYFELVDEIARTSNGKVNRKFYV